MGIILNKGSAETCQNCDKKLEHVELFEIEERFKRTKKDRSTVETDSFTFWFCSAKCLVDFITNTKSLLTREDWVKIRYNVEGMSKSLGWNINE